MSMQNVVAEKSTYMFERTAEIMPRSELDALQLSRLRATIERAINSVPRRSRMANLWRARDDSNVRPLPSEGNALSS